MRSATIALIFIFITMLGAGCGSVTANTKQTDFANRIYERYPDLNHQPMSVTTVKRVVDGDTFETAQGDKVRLIGVNTPESIGKAEPFGREASDYSKKALTGKSVYLFQDAGNTDKYGRLLRYVFLSGDEMMYNERLAREGYASTMTVPPNVMYQTLFLKAEREARQSNRGLWGKGDSGTTGAAPAACTEPTIKGNINSKGDKIYHVPGGRSYDSTVPEALFCSEKEAQDAGFRKAAN